MGDRRGGLVALVLIALLAGPSTAIGSASSTHALFFGDSLFQGDGTGPVQVRTANSLLGWRAELDAVGGTGYTTGGSRGRPYLERLRRGALSRTYDVIVIEGGTNDAHHGSVDRLRPEALAVIDYISQRQPKARLVLVGGFAPKGAPTTRYVAADRILASVARTKGLQYVSQLGYAGSSGPGFYSRDDLHPTPHGYQRMGRDLAEALLSSRAILP